MIISARIVRPRRFRRCEHCGGMIVQKALRLYGAAESTDRPYVIWLHPGCTDYSDPKIIRAKGLLV
jgi:ligand-binding sensor protein